LKFLFDDSNQNVSRHGAPDLRLDGVLAVAQKLLDAQMLFDPFEEQFDLPSVLVERCNRQRWQHKIVGQKYQSLAALGVFESNSPQVLWVIVRGIKPVEQYRLIANDACRSVDSSRVNASSVHVGLGSCHKETARTVHLVKSLEIQIAAVHYVKGPSLDWHEVEHVDLVQLSVADVHKRWYSAAQVQKRVQFYGTFGFAKRRPFEQAQTQVDRGGVQRVNRVLQVQTNQVGIAVKFARSTNQQGCNVAPNAPVARLVRIGQSRSMNAVTKPHCIKFARVGAQRRFDIAKTFAPRQLGKCHHSKLFRATHFSNAGVAVVSIDDATKTGPWHEFHDLRKERFADMHDLSPRSLSLGN